MDLNQRLGPGAKSERLGRVGKPSRLGKREASAQVRVVRDGHDPTVARARAPEPFPEPVRAVLHLHARPAPLGHVASLEDHVPVHVPPPARRAGPLVSRERGEPTRLVEGIGVVLNLLPEMSGPLEAPVLRPDAILPADLRRATSSSVEGSLPLEDGVGIPAATVPHALTRLGGIGRIVDILAEVNLSKRVVVVGNRHEVQRRSQLQHAPVGTGDRIAAAVSVGYVRAVAVCSHEVGIERPARVHVENPRSRRYERGWVPAPVPRRPGRKRRRTVCAVGGSWARDPTVNRDASTARPSVSIAATDRAFTFPSTPVTFRKVAMIHHPTPHLGGDFFALACRVCEVQRLAALSKGF